MGLRVRGLLIRHGHVPSVGEWLAGRRPGVHLTETGRAEAAAVCRALQRLPIAAVYSSPLERAVETAMPLAHACGLDVDVRPALTDIDFGEWTGRRLADLAADPQWRAFNADRERASAPGGEALLDVQRRIMGELGELATRHQGELVVLVTHAELIRCALAALLGQSLDEAMAIEISPAHVSTIHLPHSEGRVIGINERVDQIADAAPPLRP